MNKRQKIKHLQRINAKHIEARQELNKALRGAINEIQAMEEICENIKFAYDFVIEENERLKSELNKPLLSKLWRWNR